MGGLPLALLRRLNRSLVCWTVDAVVGKSVRVTSSETVADDILRAVGPAVSFTSAIFEPDESSIDGTLEKYGFLEVTYRVMPGSRTLPRAGLGVLREVGLVDPSDPNPPDGDHGILSEIADDAERGIFYLKVFARTPEDVEPFEGVRRVTEGLPSNFWPHDFLLEDACVTNARSIWLAKRVYL